MGKIFFDKFQQVLGNIIPSCAGCGNPIQVNHCSKNYNTMSPPLSSHALSELVVDTKLSGLGHHSVPVVNEKKRHITSSVPLCVLPVANEKNYFQSEIPNNSSFSTMTSSENQSVSSSSSCNKRRKSYGNPPAFRTKECVGCSLIGSQKQPSTSSNRIVAAKNEAICTQTKLHSSYINGGTPANNATKWVMMRGIKK